MTDIQYWDDTLSEEIEQINDLIEKIPNIKDSYEVQEAIDRCKSKINAASGTKRSFKMEIRLVQDVGQRRNYEARLQQLDQQLSSALADVKALEAELKRGELFDADTEQAVTKEYSKEDAVRAGDHLLAEASNIQDKTQDSLANTKNLISEAKEIGISTLEELQRQREVLHNIEKETDRLDDNLARAEALLKAFGKRMAGDQFIQCFAMINVLLFIGVLLYVIIKGGGLSGGNDAAPPAPTATTTGGQRRMLFVADNANKIVSNVYTSLLRGTTQREE